MPAIDPNPQGGQRMLLLILGTMLALTVVIAAIAVIASP